LHATRLDHALDDLAAAVRKPREQRAARALSDKAQPLFKSMQGLKTIGDGAIQGLTEFVKNSKPKDNLIFKGLDEFKVPLDTSGDDDD
jgi:hypothetical protein